MIALYFSSLFVLHLLFFSTFPKFLNLLLLVVILTDSSSSISSSCALLLSFMANRRIHVITFTSVLASFQVINEKEWKRGVPKGLGRVIPLPSGRGVWEGADPPPHIFYIYFLSGISAFWALVLMLVC